MTAEFVTRGRSFVEQGQLQEAVRVCRLGLLANPGEIEGRLVLGSALVALSRFDEVLAEMQSALSMEPDNPSALALKGEALLRKGDARQATGVLELAAQSAPGDPYVEQLRVEARASLASRSGTMDIDPELEGVELRDDDSLDDAEESSIELLDDGLLTEITPTPAPHSEAEKRAAAAAAAALAGLDDSLDEPFEDHYRGGYQPSPQVDAPAPATPKGPGPALPLAPSGSAPRSDSRSDSRKRLASIGALFPEDERGISSADYLGDSEGPSELHGELPEVSVPRGMTADMDLIREGISRPAPRTMSTARDSPSEARREVTAVSADPPRQLPWVVWAAIAVLVVAGGTVGGLKVREARLDRQIRMVRDDARSHASEDTYLGHRKARDLYGRIALVRKNDRTRGALARAEALLAAEFGDPIAGATAALAEVGDRESRHALAAAGYLALARGDGAALGRSATALIDAYPDEAAGYYLRGRARLLEGDGKAAAEALQIAIEKGPTPLTYVALARAEAERGRYPEALAAMGRATEVTPSHPAAVIWQARILADSGDLLDSKESPDELLAELVNSSVENRLSTSQRAWAALVLADVKLRRGDQSAAREALATARLDRPEDWRFSEMLIEILIRLGEYEEAREEAERASAAWPGRGSPKLMIARAKLVDGEPQAALDILGQLEGIDSSPEALTIRGKAQLELGILEQAALDLDSALELRPDDEEAVVARARVEILRGEADAAVERLEALYESGADTELAVAFAAALRSQGKAARAREVLAPFSGDGAPNVEAAIELARLEESQGRYEQARAAFQRALDLREDSVEAQLGAALLDIAEGKVSAGRKALDDLVDRGAENDLVLVEAARARTMLGDVDGARTLLSRISEDSTWLNWKVARERGRILLRRGNSIEAISELQRSQSLRPEDVETRLLLMEAHFEARNKAGAARARKEISRAFANSSIALIADGIDALLDERASDAIKAFSEARSKLLDDKASNLELASVAYWLGRSFEVSGDLLQAAQWLDKATKLDESNSGAYYWLGQIAHQNQATKLMVKNYEQAVAIDPGHNPLAWYFLGTHYAEQKQKQKAIEALEKFLRYFPDDDSDVVVEAKSLLGQIR